MPAQLGIENYGRIGILVFRATGCERFGFQANIVEEYVLNAVLLRFLRRSRPLSFCKETCSHGLGHEGLKVTIVHLVLLTD